MFFKIIVCFSAFIVISLYAEEEPLAVDCNSYSLSRAEVIKRLKVEPWEVLQQLGVEYIDSLHSMEQILISPESLRDYHVALSKEIQYYAKRQERFFKYQTEDLQHYHAVILSAIDYPWS